MDMQQAIALLEAVERFKRANNPTLTEWHCDQCGDVVGAKAASSHDGGLFCDTECRDVFKEG